MAEPIAMGIQVPNFDLGAMYERVARIKGAEAQLQHAQTGNQLALLQLQQGTALNAARQQFQKDPTNLQALAGFPELQEPAMRARGVTEEYNRTQNALAAGRVMDAGPEGSTARMQAQVEEANRGMQEGRIPALMHRALTSQPMSDQQLHGIRSQAMPIQPPRFGDIDTNPISGTPVKGWISPYGPTGANDSGVRPAVPATAGANAAQQELTGLSGPDFMGRLKEIDGGTAQQVQAMLDGRVPYPSPASRDARAKTLAWMANKVDPALDATRFQTRQKVINSFEAGPLAEQSKSLNTVAEHLDRLYSASVRLNNFNYGPDALNTAANAVARWTQPKFKAALADFEASRIAVAGEMAKVFRSAGMSVSEIDEWKQRFSSSSSPAELEQGVKSAVGLIDSRLKPLKYQWEQAIPDKPFTKVEPRVQAVFDRLREAKVEGVKPADMIKNDHGPLPQRSTQIPPAAVRYLQSNARDPSVLQQFEEKYGKGAAQQFLQQR